MSCLSRFSRVVRVALAAALLLVGPLAEAQISDMNSAINKAGRQRMLSQRMAKAYLQIGLGVDVERSKRVLDNSIAVFDRQLVELKNYAPSTEIRSTYQQLEKEWIAYKDVLVGTVPNPDGARRVLDLSETVLQLAHAGTEQLVSISGSETGPLVGVAGRQRMLSQRIAKYYQAQVWGVSPANATVEFEKSRRSFAVGLKALSAAPSTTQAIRDELERARQQCLLDAMDVITGMFEKLGG